MLETKEKKITATPYVRLFADFFLRRCVFGNECLLHTNYTIISLLRLNWIYMVGVVVAAVVSGA